MSEAFDRAARIGGHLIAAKPLARAMGGLGWMAGSAARTWTMLSALFRPAPPPLPPEDLKGLPTDPTERFAALQRAVGWSSRDVDAQRKGARASFVSYFVASVLLLVWAVAAPGLGMAPGATAILPWVILIVTAAKMIQRSQDHYHLKHRRLTPFREWIAKPENVLLPLFEDAPPAGAVVKGIALVVLGAALAPVAAMANGLATPSAIQVLAAELPASDLSLQWVQRIFPSFFPAMGVSAAQDATAQLLALVNTMLLTAGAFYLLYEVVSGVVAAAHTGKVFSERYHGPWVPVRVAVGVGSVFPVAGYCVAQLLVIYVTLFGYKMANEAWKAHVQLAMAISPVQGPGLPADGRWSIAPGGGTVSVPPDLVAQLPTLQGLITSELCFHAARWGSRVAGQTNNPPEQPQLQNARGLAGARPMFALPPVSGTDQGNNRVWDYGQVCGSISFPIRPAPSATAPPPGAPNLVVLRIAAENRVAERAQAMRDYDIARAQAFSRLVTAVRTNNGMNAVAALSSQGYTGEIPNVNEITQRIIQAYGQFKSDLITASTTLSATLNREARAGAMDRVNQLGWAAAGAFQPALASMNRTVVERVVELPAIQGVNVGAFASTRDMREILERSQRFVGEAIYAAFPVLAAANGVGTNGSMSEINTIRELRTNPDTAISTWMARMSRRIFQSFEGMARLDTVDPLTSIRNHGQAMEAVLLGGMATWTVVNVAFGGAEGAADGVSNSIAGWFGAGVPAQGVTRAIRAGLAAMGSFVTSFFWWGLAISALYSTVLPMLGYMFWLFAVAGAITYLIEAVVGAAFWAFAHVKSDNGQEFVGNAQRAGYSILFNSAFRPTLMIIGLALGHVVFAVTASFVNGTFAMAVDSAFSGEAFYGSRIISPVGLLVLAGMIFYIHYQLAVRSYSLITELPDRVARWSGASGEGLGEAGHFEEANRTVVGGVMSRTTAYGASAGAMSRAFKSGGQDADHGNHRPGRDGGAADGPGPDLPGIRPVSGPKGGVKG